MASCPPSQGPCDQHVARRGHGSLCQRGEEAGRATAAQTNSSWQDRLVKRSEICGLRRRPRENELPSWHVSKTITAEHHPPTPAPTPPPTSPFTRTLQIPAATVAFHLPPLVCTRAARQPPNVFIYSEPLGEITASCCPFSFFFSPSTLFSGRPDGICVNNISLVRQKISTG